MSVIEVGLIGFGVAGRNFHAPVIRAVSGLRLAAILQRSGFEAEQKYPDVRVVKELDELLAISSIQLVVIATPPASHFELAKRCLLAGRHLVVDKPFTTTLHEARDLVVLAAERRCILSVYHNRRWDGDFLTVQQLVTSGQLGVPALFESHFDRFRPRLRENAWREKAGPGSGILFDLGPHMLDQAFVLFGRPQSLMADIRMERDGAVADDAFDIVLHYEHLRIILRAGSLVSTPTPRFVVEGTKGGYLKYGFDPQEEALKRGEVPTGEGWGREAEAKWGQLFLDRENGLTAQKLATVAGDYRRYYENIRDAILAKTNVAVTPEQALSVMQGLELARESSRRGQLLSWPA